MNSSQAKAALREKGGYWRPRPKFRRHRRAPNVIGLTPDVCQLVVLAGGPTFWQNGKDLRCNQTNRVLKLREVEGYRVSVSGQAQLAAKPTQEGGQNYPAESKSRLTVMTSGLSSYVKCPFCSQKNFRRSDTIYCADCGKQFNIEQLSADSPLRAQIAEKEAKEAEYPLARSVRGIFSQYAYCPHCQSLLEQREFQDGNNTCPYCNKKYRIAL